LHKTGISLEISEIML